MLSAKQLAHKVASGRDIEEEDYDRRSPLSEVKKGNVVRPTLMLEVSLKAGEAPLRMLGVVQNFAGGEVILKVQGPVAWMDWESLAGREASLHGEAVGIIKDRKLPGTVMWARKREEDDFPAIMAVALSKLGAKERKALEERLLRPPQDIKGLWEHWDKKRDRAAAARVGSQTLYLLGLILGVVGLIMRSHGVSGYLPVLLLACGGGIVATKLLWSFLKK